MLLRRAGWVSIEVGLEGLNCKPISSRSLGLVHTTTENGPLITPRLYSIPSLAESSRLIDEKIKELGDWRGKTLAKVREVVHAADREIGEGRENLSGTGSFGVQSGPLDAKGGQNYCGHLRAPWNTRRISTTLLRTR